MTKDDRMIILRQAVTNADDPAKVSQGKPGGGQRIVADRIGYSPAALNQVLRGKYAGNTEAVLARVEEVYGNKTTACPKLGEIPLARCADNRDRANNPALRSTNPGTLQLYAACRRCRAWL